MHNNKKEIRDSNFEKVSLFFIHIIIGLLLLHIHIEYFRSDIYINPRKYVAVSSRLSYQDGNLLCSGFSMAKLYFVVSRLMEAKKNSTFFSLPQSNANTVLNDALQVFKIFELYVMQDRRYALILLNISATKGSLNIYYENDMNYFYIHLTYLPFKL
jgi:hypothetical protein